jgi:peptidoglycan/LPS O-acetylase OafA/YrhL
VGLVSYSLYLWHQPVILWMKGHGLLDSSGPGALVYNVVIVFLVAMVLASITYYLVEKPAMSLRGRLPARTVVMG